MKKWRLLPSLAAKGVVQNGNIYYPYFVSGIFSVFTYFLFASILRNDLIGTLPHSVYAWMMLMIGKALLGIILLLFLLYTGSFLTKRRKKELGLYSLLGLERKHIGILLFYNALITFTVTVCGGMILGIVLSKFFFLLLLRLASLPIQAEFVFTWGAASETLVYFAVVYAVSYLVSLWSLGSARPAELLSDSRSGEKEPRFLAVWTLSGVLILASGYFAAVTSKLDSGIFIRFFMAIFLVILGTYILFAAVMVSLLRFIQKRKKIYYRPSNFVVISGMYYRMKKSASGLANICIFSTMVIITLICTAALYAGMEEIGRYDYPYDARITYNGDRISRDEAESKMRELAAECHLDAERLESFDFASITCQRDGKHFSVLDPSDSGRQSKCTVYIITLEDCNALTGREDALEERQAMVYAPAIPYGYDTLEWMDMPLEVTEELDLVYPWPKSGGEAFQVSYILAVRDEEARDACIRAWEQHSGQNYKKDSMLQYTGTVLKGSQEEKREYLQRLSQWCREQEDSSMSCVDGLEGRTVLSAMNGGLLFIGIMFGLVFFMCLLLVMYYKQISEGYEDQNSFDIMQKVGMSNEEIKSAVQRQVLMIFFLPLSVSLLHTLAGMVMVRQMMAVLLMFDTHLLAVCMVSVCAVFILIYSTCYVITSRSYYRIVKGPENIL